MMHIYTKKQNEMNKHCTLTEAPPPLLRIHIDDISNIKPLNTIDSKRLPELMEWISGGNIRMAKDNTHIVMSVMNPYIFGVESIFSIGKALMEIGYTNIKYDEGEKALDMYYDTASHVLYWDASYTNRVIILMITTNPLIQEKVEKRIINALGSYIISYKRRVMLIDAHGECDAVMGRITRICDMLSYEISPKPHIYNDNDRYVSSGNDYYISIFKMLS